MKKPLVYFLISCICVLGLSQLSIAQEPPLKKVRLLLDWYPQAENGGYICALAEGYYKKAGLDVEISAATTNLSVEPAVAIGRYQFGLSTSDRVLAARCKGLPLVGVLASMEHDPTAVMVHAESPVKSFPDLEGHAIAIPPGAVWLRYLVHKYQFKSVSEIPDTFELATFIHSPDYIEECLVTAEPYAMSKNHIPIRTLLLMDTGYDPYHLLITTDSTVQQDPAMVQAFVQASREGWRHYLTDPVKADQQIKLLNPEEDQGQIDFSRQALIQGHFVDGFAAKQEDVGLLKEERFKDRYTILRSLGMLDHDFDFHTAFTIQFLGAPPGNASK